MAEGRATERPQVGLQGLRTCQLRPPEGTTSGMSSMLLQRPFESLVNCKQALQETDIGVAGYRSTQKSTNKPGLFGKAVRPLGATAQFSRQGMVYCGHERESVCGVPRADLQMPVHPVE